MDCEKILAFLNVVLAAFAVILAWRIPRNIMMRQMYADLLGAYRSPEMGAAIHAIFAFYVNDCGNDSTRIPCEYKNRFEREKDCSPSKRLHFQRRLAAQFYADFAGLYFFGARRWLKKEIVGWFTEGEVKLLGILLLMAKPASEVFLHAKNLPEPPENGGGAEMNKMIYRLYEEVKEW
jgi:hypothetical protein